MKQPKSLAEVPADERGVSFEQWLASQQIADPVKLIEYATEQAERERKQAARATK
jgi:hypothetical protein